MGSRSSKLQAAQSDKAAVEIRNEHLPEAVQKQQLEQEGSIRFRMSPNLVEAVSAGASQKKHREYAEVYSTALVQRTADQLVDQHVKQLRPVALDKAVEKAQQSEVQVLECYQTHADTPLDCRAKVQEFQQATREAYQHFSSLVTQS